MSRAAVALTLTASGLLLIAGSAANSRGQVEAGEGGPSFGLDTLSDRVETAMNRATQTLSSSGVSADAAGRSIAAFLTVLRLAEGTEGQGRDPYRVVYGYGHTIGNLADHPAITGEWRGARLPDAMCINAGFKPGCVSTAAGAYQTIRGTWVSVRDALRLPDFGPASQDAAAVELIRRRGALEDVKAGRFESAVQKCRNEWASLPGNYAKQGQRSMGTLLAWYQQHGGIYA